MVDGSGLFFHPDLRDEILAPPPCHVYAVRPHTHTPFYVRGPHEVQIGRYHPSARVAVTAILAFLQHRRCTAIIRIFTPDAQLWREDAVALDKTITHTWPRASPTNHAE